MAKKIFLNDYKQNETFISCQTIDNKHIPYFNPLIEKFIENNHDIQSFLNEESKTKQIIVENRPDIVQLVGLFDNGILKRCLFIYYLRISFHNPKPIPVLYEIIPENKYQIKTYRLEGDSLLFVNLDSAELKKVNETVDCHTFFSNTPMKISLKLIGLKTQQLYEIRDHNDRLIFELSTAETIEDPIARLRAFLELRLHKPASLDLKCHIDAECDSLIKNICHSTQLLNKAIEILSFDPLFIEFALDYRNDCFNSEQILFLQKIFFERMGFEILETIRDPHAVQTLTFRTIEKGLESSKQFLYTLHRFDPNENHQQSINKVFQKIQDFEQSPWKASEHIVEIIVNRSYPYADMSKHFRDLLLNSRNTEGLTIKKVVFVLKKDMGYKHYTFNRTENDFIEDTNIRNLSLPLAQFLELNHLNQFNLKPDLERWENHIYLYLASGKNIKEKDNRLVGITLIYHPQMRTLDDSDITALNLEENLDATLNAMERSLSEFDKNKKPIWNRIFLNILPVLNVPITQFDTSLHTLLEKNLARFRKLHFQKILIRARLKDQTKKEGYEYRLIEARDFSKNHFYFDAKALPIHDSRLWETPLATPSELREQQALSKGGFWAYHIPDLIAELAKEFRFEEFPSSAQSSIESSFQELDLDPTKITVDTKTGMIDYNLGELIPVSRPPGLNQAGIVIGIQTDDLNIGIPVKRLLLIGDLTHSKGAINARECARINAAIRYAAKNKIPIDWLTASYGVEILFERGVESLDAASSTAREIITHCERNGVQINLIIDETNIGAQSYWDALAAIVEETSGILIMTPRGSMALTGPNALTGAIFSTVHSEDIPDYAKNLYPKGLQNLSGFTEIHGPNSDAMILAKDIVEACKLLLRHHFYSYKKSDEILVAERLSKIKSEPQDFLDDSTISSQLSSFSKGVKADRQLILEALRTPNSPPPLKFWSYAKGIQRQNRDKGDLTQEPTTTVQEMLIGNQPVMAISPPTGQMTPADSQIISRAIYKADQRMPVLIIGSLTGFSADPLSMLDRQLVGGASIAQAIVKHQGPILIVILGYLVGGTFVVFSKQLNPQLKILAMEGAHIQVIGGKSAAKVVFTHTIQKQASENPKVVKLEKELMSHKTAKKTKIIKSVQAIEEAYKLLKRKVISELEEKEAVVFDQIHSVERALKTGSIDEIISIGNWRSKIIQYIHNL